MKVYLVPNSIVNYTKFVSSKLLIYFVISNGKGCKHAQARVFWAWQVSLKTHQEVLLDMFLSWAIAQGYISLLTFSSDQFFCNKYLFGLFFGVCVCCHFLCPGVSASLLLKSYLKGFHDISLCNFCLPIAICCQTGTEVWIELKLY